jgi:hypothetical protein
MTESTIARPITVEDLHEALNLICYHEGDTVESPDPVCDWQRLCGQHCKFPRYFRHGGPVGLTAHTLVEVGYPMDLLKAMDCEYEVGEVLHPGVKIGRSRNAALARLDNKGVALLEYVQNHSKVGWSWSDIVTHAFRPTWTVKYLDSRRRPWLY